MQTLDLQQGSDEWNATRARYNTASEAPAMMGASKKTTRNELLRMKATGSEKEFSDWVREVLFERGHEIEAAARPFAESLVGEELYPATGVSDDGKRLSSFDGITMAGIVIWECKQWNEAKADDVRAGQIPEEDYWQVVQQFDVSSAARCLYMVTDGTEAGSVYLWIERASVEADIERLHAGWAQFNKDVASYQPPQQEVIVAGTAPETLPALRVEISGRVVASNLDSFRSHAVAVIEAINTELETDEDFASAEKTVKWCSDVEDRLAATKDAAQSQAADIDTVFRTMDEISAMVREKRLLLNRLVTEQKKQRRDNILLKAREASDNHIAEINSTLGPRIRMPAVPVDFAGVMKGKRTLSSLQNAVDTELARFKIEADRIANGIRKNLELLRADAKGYETLFADAQALVTSKTPEDLANLIRVRITEHRAAEEEKRRAEEQAKAAAEDRAKAAAAPPPAPMPTQAVETASAPAAAAQPANETGGAPAPVADSGQRMKLGDINALIAPLSISADGLAQLGFTHVGQEKAAKLYRASDWPRIAARLVQHIQQAGSEMARAA
ncbi:YqaJ viral recombinase family protein [Flagellatimonas centrodinii]|uniref:YqaJ viral recombinase family protein n=1 Tax=Flagellatimonas centrodinii TaxID=2806210 RepID=UPI001FEFC8B2|nr:YqaJ viral recombinase family protein [Flagellatimonas centrodinii]ULQ47430.1 YqaJ viral recombinase family protein [Flagellatimonas centrodinii]